MNNGNSLLTKCFWESLNHFMFIYGSSNFILTIDLNLVNLFKEQKKR